MKRALLRGLAHVLYFIVKLWDFAYFGIWEPD